MYLKTSLIVIASCLCATAFARIRVNVTVMVPGISAFQKLVKLSEEIYNRNTNDIGYYGNENATETDYMPTRGVKAEEEYYYPGVEESDILSGSEYYHEMQAYGDEEASSDISYFYGSNEAFESCANETIFADVCNCVLRYFRFYEWSYIFVKPALEIALSEIESSPEFMDNLKISLQYRDSAGEYGEASSG